VSKTKKYVRATATPATISSFSFLSPVKDDSTSGGDNIVGVPVEYRWICSILGEGVQQILSAFQCTGDFNFADIVVWSSTTGLLRCSESSATKAKTAASIFFIREFYGR
jgi:hypothetical protein